MDLEILYLQRYFPRHLDMYDESVTFVVLRDLL